MEYYHVTYFQLGASLHCTLTNYNSWHG